jgi:orotate phosphoribosyltransferase
MNSSVIIQIIEWAGIIALSAYVIASAYRDIVEILYDKGVPLPKPIEEALYSRKKKEISHALEEIGIKSHAEPYKQLNQILGISEKRPFISYQQELEKILAISFTHGTHEVGKTYSQRFGYFIDLTGATTDYQIAERCSRILANFIRDEMNRTLTDESRPIVFNKIVVPKSGSPTIGFLLSQVLRVPCVFFRGDSEPKVRSSSDVSTYFDGSVLPSDKLILIDDSTTGGRMFNQAITKIREAKAEVHHAFILFEPIGKDARGLLAHSGVDLHSIVQMNDETISRLSNQAKKLRKTKVGK